MLYVKRPIPVEAVKVERENRDQIISLLEKGVTTWEETENGFIVHFWDGVEPIEYGSNYWIIKGIKGECYPCEGRVFEGSYEPVKGQRMKEAVTLANFLGVPAFVSCSVIVIAIEFYINLNDEMASLWLNYACFFAVAYLVYLAAFLTWCFISWIIEKHKSKKEGQK